MLDYIENYYTNIEDATNYLQKKYNKPLFISPLHKPHSVIQSDTIYVMEQKNNIIVGLLKSDTDPQELFSHISLTIYEDENSCQLAANKLTKKNILYYIVTQSFINGIDYFIDGTKNINSLMKEQIIEKCAIYIPDDFIQEDFKEYLKTSNLQNARVELIEQSNLVLDNYSKWCRGEVFGYSIVLYDLQGEVIEADECFGLVDFSFALKELITTMQNYAIENEITILAQEVIVQNRSSSFAKTLPFEIDTKNLEQFQHIILHHHHIVAANYSTPYKAICYCYEENQDYILKVPYDILQMSYEIDIHQFLKMVMYDQVKEILRKHIYHTLYPEKF